MNVLLTAVCSVVIAVLGLLLALARTSRAPALAPFRLLATVYVDVFRGVPLLLVILLIGFGVPALGLTGVTSNVVLLGGAAVALTYSAYVAEVFRAGILGVNPISGPRRARWVCRSGRRCDTSCCRRRSVGAAAAAQ